MDVVTSNAPIFEEVIKKSILCTDLIVSKVVCVCDHQEIESGALLKSVESFYNE